MKRRKRYTVTDNKSGYKNHYSWIAWNAAWALVFISGIIFGITLF